MILLAIGFFSGIISGMGIGGGTILIPALIFFQDISQHQAQSINLIYFIPTAVIALYYHFKNHNIEKSVVKPIVIWGLIGAAGGSFIAVAMDASLLKKLFAGFLFVMGLLEIFKKQKA